MSTARITSGGREVEISNADKVLFPETGLTKRDLARYYAKIADTALPHYRGFPVTLKRYPDGIGAQGFFQKNLPDHFPDWIDRVTLPKEGGALTQALVSEPATLVFFADQACITPHLGLARAAKPRNPVRLVFDLDPSDGSFAKVQKVARVLRDELEARALPSFVQTTGSRGLHIVLSLDGSADVDALRPFARGLAEAIAARLPDLATTEQRKDRRGNRVLVDTFRTAYAQTAVAPYALRARPGAPVATPLRWDEALASDMSPRRYDIASVFRRLGQIDDPWADIDDDPIRATDLIEGD
jgi:bifunctional non-homologous end joining protein LigD